MRNAKSRRRNTLRRSKLQKRFARIESLEARRLLTGDDFAPGGDGIVEGFKWQDDDGDGRRDADELGLAGVTIYADVNQNGRLESDEPAVVTLADDPATALNETGRYRLNGLPDGVYAIREIVPDGFRQTFPWPGDAGADADFATAHPRRLAVDLSPDEVHRTIVAVTVHPQCVRPFELDVVALNGDAVGVKVENLSGIQINGCGGQRSEFEIRIASDDPTPRTIELGFVDQFGGDPIAVIPVHINGASPATDGHRVAIRGATHITGLDFGNQETAPRGGIAGRVWLDDDANGRQDPGEPGLGGVEIYLDLNDDGRPNAKEPRTHTEFEDPVTDFDEGGLYSFGPLEPGVYTVREVVPRGYVQTFPGPDAEVINSQSTRFSGEVNAIGFTVSDVAFKSDGEDSAAVIGMATTWRNGCGSIIAGETDHAVVGDVIVIDMHGFEPLDALCTEAIVTETTDVVIEGLGEGEYTVVATLHERFGDRPDEATFAAVGEIRIGPGRGHRIFLESNQTVENVNFGVRRTGGMESVSGYKWNDRNGDGVRQRDEPGLGGVTIYVDLDRNGQLNEGEPSTVTLQDGLFSPRRLGFYRFELPPGVYSIREIVPEGYHQTFPGVNEPSPNDDVPQRSATHRVTLHPGEHLANLDFGNQSTAKGAISGGKWHDLNGNRRWEADEPGLPGVTIFVDVNGNREFDEGEPSAITQRDDPSTEVDETGSYEIEDLSPGDYFVHEIIPNGYVQTFPLLIFDATGNPPNNAHFVNVEPGRTRANVNFGNRRAPVGDASIRGFVWNDANANALFDRGEELLPGGAVYLDLNENERRDANEPMTEELDGEFEFAVEPGEYTVRYIARDGFETTYPYTSPRLEDYRSTVHVPEVSVASFELIEVSVPDTSPTDGSVSEVEFTFEIVGGEHEQPQRVFSTGVGFHDGVIVMFIDAEPNPDPSASRTEIVSVRLPLEPGRRNRLRAELVVYPAGHEVIDIALALSATVETKVLLPRDDAHQVVVAVGESKSIAFGASPQHVPGDPPSVVDRLLGDANNDNVVDLSDFLILKQNFGLAVEGGFIDGDFDRDGEVTLNDFAILARNLGSER